MSFNCFLIFRFISRVVFKALLIEFFMAKGFWLVTTMITNQAFSEFIQAFQPWVEEAGVFFYGRYVSQIDKRKGGKVSSHYLVSFKAIIN